ncbi:helix-turn-helix domain-containing protein [Ohtaekwangia koreensis]|uniref:helix-turn-helix domain-containing protein n=1 Tax=Ohtaekwangia koreensis TaxID=688867 RepID=UPI0009A84DA8
MLEQNLGQENIKVSPLETLRNASQEYFEVNEAASIMRISRRTLYRLISLKKIKKKKMLSRTVILKDDIKSFFTKQYISIGIYTDIDCALKTRTHYFWHIIQHLPCA